MEVLTLCLHRVVPDDRVEANWPWLERGSAITESTLGETLAALCKDYTPCTEDEVAAALQSGVSANERLLWITFDDGYRDNLYVAAPILEAFGVRPTLFVTSRVLSPPFRLPVDRWYDIVRRASGPVRTVDLGEGPLLVDPASRAFRQRMVDGPEKRKFIRSSPREQAAWLRRLGIELAASPRFRGREHAVPAEYVAPNDVVVLTTRGWRVGGHGLSHRLLPGLPNSILAKELLCEDLRSIVPDASRSRFFAWPDGAFDERVITVAERTLSPHGVVGALSIDPGRPFTVSNRWALPRVLGCSLPFIQASMTLKRGDEK